MIKILVIEDDEFIRENLIELLLEENFTVLEAENGAIGAELAVQERPDLILCDIMMPCLDGYGVLQKLRTYPETETIPFIFLTAKATKIDQRQGMELGADDYLTKPCSQEELLKAISTRLKKQAAVQKNAQDKLEELRSNITLSLPHELRTPLQGILGFSELLINEAEEIEPSEIREIGEYINTSGERLSQLIHNFLLYAELELMATNPEGLKMLRSHQINNSKTIIAEVSRAKAIAANREADLHLYLQESLVNISEARLKKIAEELVENAFKFSAEGTPVRVVSRNENNYFTLTIGDRGRGIASEYIDKVGAYMQFDRKLYEQQGTGFGLIIAKRLAELHGGKLILESIPGQETTVRVILPAMANG
ncbi:MAG: response regulator [Hormoscilla sp.]